jgi:phosphate transport system substrate-binding protein
MTISKTLCNLSLKKIACTIASMALIFSAPENTYSQAINGAGATFPFPLYSQWAYKYDQLQKIKINYQSIGSGGGIAQIKAKTVDFGASDAPLEKTELDSSGLIQFPMIMGGIVPIINVKGVKDLQLKIAPDVMAGIFLGTIKNWNDPKIKAANPGVNLPNLAITVVHRADGSGTTWIFTNYLDKVSPEWHSKAGTGKSVSWPTGIGGKGNEGVAAYVQRVNGAIGYVEYAYALQNKMTSVLLKNAEGIYVSPTIDTFQAAASNADWKNAPGFYMVLTNQPGKNSWPITGASFILVQKDQKDLNKAKIMLNYFQWCYLHGGDMAKQLHYIPMPQNVVNLVNETWKKDIKSDGQPVWK